MTNVGLTCALDPIITPRSGRWLGRWLGRRRLALGTGGLLVSEAALRVAGFALLALVARLVAAVLGVRLAAGLADRLDLPFASGRGLGALLLGLVANPSLGAGECPSAVLA